MKKYIFASILLAGSFFAQLHIAYTAEVIDIDSDGLSDQLEAIYYTDPHNPDTDGDGYQDGLEVDKGFSPHAGGGTQMHQFDYDHDGLNDWLERWFHTDSGMSDSDGDGYSDFAEVMGGYNPDAVTTTEKFSRQIIVDRTVQRLYYMVDSVKILNLPVSTGNPDTETPAGNYNVSRKIPNKRYVGPGYDLSNVLWNMEFQPGYFIHAAYWHNDFGVRTHSHGCVNLREADADLLYEYVDVGVSVVVAGETPKKYRVGT